MTQVVVTGANGFVGRALCRVLLNNGHQVAGLVRRSGACPTGVAEWVDAKPDFAGVDACWRAAPGDVECVVHLAARVHVMNEAASEAAQRAFDATNIDATLRVARAAHRNGARRFVYVSSIKAVAESDGGRPLDEDTPARPEDAYGRSKRDAEQALKQFGDETGLDIVIVRPPLVYGPDVRANFLRMMNAVARGMPLPFGAISSRRSLLYVGNLADALLHCATDPRAAGGCFHVADDDPPSVTELLRMIGDALGRPARLLPVPGGVLRLLGKLTGRGPQIDRLTGSLQVDTGRLKRSLDWKPPFTTRQGLAATANWYRSRDTRQ
ncbi:NAD-dependent epimerase/dehydratase family protein [Burkholderia guangdongensis]|uniref:NAD-dependent epimerase/dehydratase family protein n=1 Tax=Burkholderia guangdongensis TaxID=1792500 RepID=UPI0015C911CB